ncbi:hypothetical protein BDP67DRAFT_562246 [Colletotrichum lupini]|nr:hypothetical protein BDP67DRAFT_562246 [Colletotrichum lupini]
MSYLYEHDMYHHCTLADWADLNHDGQVAAYTALRDFRSEHVDEIIEDAKRRAESKTPHPHGPYRGPGIDMNATSSMGIGDWLPEDLVPEQCDGSYVEVDFEANEDTDGGWGFSDGGSGFPVDTGSAGLDTSGGNGGGGDGSNNNGGGSGDGSHGGDNSHAGSSSNDQSWQSMMGML